MIEVKHLGKSYPQQTENINVFSDLNFKIAQGESVAIMGPSGCGKTTLLNLLCGILRPNTGSIIVNHTDIKSLNENEMRQFRLKHIGLIFQEDRFLPQLTIKENILLPTIGEKNIDTSRVDTLLSKLNLPNVSNRFPHELSGGERQRCAIARALIHSPKIILADEPTGRLDAKNAKIVLESLQKLVCDFDVTLLMVTHSQFASEKMRRIITLSNDM